MSVSTLDELLREVDDAPRKAGPRLRLGAALLAAGDVEAAASHLQLAARLEPGNPHVALIALEALVRSGKAREGALLLSSHVRRQTTTTRVAEAERALLEELLVHPEAYVRCHTARALGRLRVVQCSEALERCCDDPDGAVRLAAVSSLRLLKAH